MDSQQMAVDLPLEPQQIPRPPIAPKPVRELKVEDALLYLDQVKMEFSDKPQIYNEFLEIMKNFKAQSITTPGVIERVKNLFRGYNKLILGFNTFLPEGEGYKIELTPEEEAQSRPGQNTVERVDRSESSAPPTPKDAFKPPQQMQQQHAISYVTTIRNRFAEQPETYRSFLKILHTYQKEQKGIKDVLEQVSALFADHPDLLMEFTYFLPDAVQDQAKERLARAVRESEVRRQKHLQMQAAQQMQSQMSNQPHPQASASAKRSRLDKDAARSAAAERDKDRGDRMDRDIKDKEKVDNRLMKKELSTSSQASVAASTTRRGGGRKKGEPGIVNAVSNVGSRDGELQQIVQLNALPAVSTERKFFEQVKELLNSGSRDGWSEFIKCLELFSVGAIGRRDLLIAVQDLFGSSNGDAFEEFKALINGRIPQDSSPQELWFALPLSEIDFQQCRRCTPSYRALPKEFPVPQCSERGPLEKAVLNDTWVSIPIGSEESYSFKHMRKNQFEDALFRCEDERFEIDMIIDSNMCTIKVLDPIADEIKQLKACEDSEAAIAKFNFQMDKRNLSAIHLFAIARIYGDHGLEILEHMRKNPAASVGVILKRLKQKDLEWRKARQELNKQWKEIQEKNFERSFDHRSFYFRQVDKKSYSAKMLVAELKALMEPALITNGTLSTTTSTSVPPTTVPVVDDPSNSTSTTISSLRSLVGNPSNSLLPGIGGVDAGVLTSTQLGQFARLSSQVPMKMSPQMALIYTNEDYDILKDIYRIICYAAETSTAQLSQSDRERVAALWRDLLRFFFDMPSHYLYGGLSSSLQNGISSLQNGVPSPIDTADPIPTGTRVVTIHGSGIVENYRPSDGMYQIRLDWGTGFMHSSVIVGSEILSPAALQAIGVVRDSHGHETILNLPPTSYHMADADEVDKGSSSSTTSVFFGTQICYVFLRLHHTLFLRLKLARKLAKDAVHSSSSSSSFPPGVKSENALAYDASLSSSRLGIANTNKSLYGTYFSELMAVVDGSLEEIRYEDSCRQLLGHLSYPLQTMNKIILQTLKCLQAMANDENVNKLVGLFMYHRSRPGRVNVDLYRDHVGIILTHTLEEVYRMEIKLIPAEDKPSHHQQQQQQELSLLSTASSDPTAACDTRIVFIQMLGVLSSSMHASSNIARTPQVELLPDADEEQDVDEDVHASHPTSHRHSVGNDLPPGLHEKELANLKPHHSNSNYHGDDSSSQIDAMEANHTLPNNTTEGLYATMDVDVDEDGGLVGHKPSQDSEAGGTFVDEEEEENSVETEGTGGGAEGIIGIPDAALGEGFSQMLAAAGELAELDRHQNQSQGSQASNARGTKRGSSSNWADEDHGAAPKKRNM